jgi:rsbT antagonist protein RsbS
MNHIPILKLGRCLLVTVQTDLHDRLVLALQDDLGQRIVKEASSAVLIDISALDVVDSFIGSTIARIAAMARVLDAQTVLVGMRPAVAITLVELGLTLDGVRTALDIERGIALLERDLREQLWPGSTGLAAPPSGHLAKKPGAADNAIAQPLSRTLVQFEDHRPAYKVPGDGRA